MTTVFDLRRKPWDEIGAKIQNAPNSAEAIKQGGLDWLVEQEPVFRPNGEAVDPYLFNIRQDTGAVLGIVTSRYQIVQNHEAFAFTDALIGTGQAYYETTGVLNGGKRIWLTASLPERTILGDKVAPYLFFTHGHDGNYAVKVAITPIRTACWNAYTLTLAHAQRTWTAKHYAGIMDRLDEAQLTLGLVDGYMREMNKTAETLAAKKLSEVQVDRIIEQLYPMPEEPSKRAEDNVIQLRGDLITRYKFAPDLANIRGTAWGLVSAVADHETHVEPIRRSARFRERRLEKVVDGMANLNKAVILARAA